MNTRKPLPQPFTTGAFRTRDLTKNGVPHSRLRAADLYRGVHGVRSVESPTSTAEVCGLIRVRMPDAAFFSHTSAAKLHGIPLPYRLESDRTHVSLPAPSRAPHAAGIAGHMLQIEDHELTERDGLRVTTPIRTWLDLGTMLSLHDLVAAGDYLVHWRLPHATILDLADALAARLDRRGRRLLTKAVGLLNERAESAPESILRVIITLAGLPEPRVNHAVSDRFGEFVARTDLMIDEYKIVLEYQGDYHRKTPGQWRADMTRRSRLEALGWRVMELNADDLKDPEELIRRIRSLASLPLAH
jgi:very-short-patch-repair endonuclease